MQALEGVMNDSSAQPVPRTAVITCAVLETEIEHFARDLKHLVRVVKLEQGLHNVPDQLRVRLQQAVDQVETDPAIEVIVLGYGLCSRGIEGVHARRCRLVVPRAHDCITLLLGSRHRYAEYVAAKPGTYWYSPGWNRHHIPPGPERYNKLLEQYRQKYGEDNAEYLMQAEQSWFHTYNQATYVHLTVGTTERDKQYTRECAQWLGWSYDEQVGDPALLKALLGGEWDTDRFLVLEPGQTVRMTADQQIIQAVPADTDVARDT